MAVPELVRLTSHGVTLLGDTHRPGGVTFAFTERDGGVSSGCYSSLNLGDGCGDVPEDVEANRALALEALGLAHHADALVNPVQVHGDKVVVVGGGGRGADDARREARAGADAIVCVEAGVPVLLCSADCALVVLVAPGGFAVAHSGWRGTVERIAAKALRALVRELGCCPRDVVAYVGPHIGAEDYEVPAERARQFVDEFGPSTVRGERNVDLGRAIALALMDEGVPEESICVVNESTASNTDRYFSYRAQGGRCGRMGAIACLADDASGEGVRHDD